MFVCGVSFNVSVLKRQRAILEDGVHHTVVWQRYYRKLRVFGLVGSAHFYAGRCAT